MNESEEDLKKSRTAGPFNSASEMTEETQSFSMKIAYLPKALRSPIPHPK
jgi:hypothetical protein